MQLLWKFEVRLAKTEMLCSPHPGQPEWPFERVLPRCGRSRLLLTVRWGLWRHRALNGLSIEEWPCWPSRTSQESQTQPPPQPSGQSHCRIELRKTHISAPWSAQDSLKWMFFFLFKKLCIFCFLFFNFFLFRAALFSFFNIILMCVVLDS